MPDFRLSAEDVTILADYLLPGDERQGGAPPASHEALDSEAALAQLARAYPGVARASAGDQAWAAFGEAVAAAGSCAACHELPGASAAAPTALPLALVNPEKGCLAPSRAPQSQAPAYRLDAAERRALSVYVASGIALVDSEGAVHRALLGPAAGRMPSRLTGFDVLDHAFELHYRLEDERGVSLLVTETYAPAAQGKAVGMERTLRVEGVPQGEQVIVVTRHARVTAPLPAAGSQARLAFASNADRKLTREPRDVQAGSATWRSGMHGGVTEDQDAVVLWLTPGKLGVVSFVERILAE